MGFNTTVVVLNDALSYIRDDPEFGRRLYDAVTRAHSGPQDVAAHSKRGIHCNAAIVIETHHADYDVIVRVGRNTGEVLKGKSESRAHGAKA